MIYCMMVTEIYIVPSRRRSTIAIHIYRINPKVNTHTSTKPEKG